MKITAICGGVGGAKLALGLDKSDCDLSIIANTGDDFNHYGLTICPDIDTILYTLSGKANAKQGWGRANETFGVLSEMEVLGEENWFTLGDKDIALHLIRTQLLKSGNTLSDVTNHLRKSLGITSVIVPMSNEPSPTQIKTDIGFLDFQDYFVRHRCKPRAEEIIYHPSKTSPEALELLGDTHADGIIFCPSNPLLSIAPLLQTNLMRETLRARSAPSLAVSPFIDGKAVKGPTDKLFKELGYQSNSLGVARFYEGLIDIIVIDESEEACAPMIESHGIGVIVTNTFMQTTQDKIQLANTCLKAISK